MQTPTPDPIPISPHRDRLAAFVLALAWTLLAALRLRDDPMPFAFAGLLGVVVTLPLAAGRGYAIAAATITLGVAIVSGPGAAAVVAAVALGMWGAVELLAAFRVDRSLAIVLQLLAAVAFLTWPIWAANLLLRFDAQPLVNALTGVGPLFAINRAIDPTDAFTHRPWAYRWMNLGQDVPYALPPTIWPGVLAHAALGVAGAVAHRWRRRVDDR